MDITLFTEPFIVRALVAGLLLALIVGPLGCLVVWRRMAYFGDSLAHSALLGVALGMMAGIGVSAGIVMVCAVFAVLLVWLQQRRWLATDTLLGILAHSALSVGMVAMSFSDVPMLNLESYLFGDLLSVSWRDAAWLAGGGAVVLALLYTCWPKLVLLSLSEDLARAEGVRPLLMQLLLSLMMALVVALSMRLVGILLITSLLVIPAAAARQMARAPWAMAVLAQVLGMLAVIVGIGASVAYDTPTGPSIVCAAALLFALSLPLSASIKRA